MKSFLLHFSLLLAMLAGGCLQSWAQVTPVASTATSGDGVYEYYVRSARKTYTNFYVTVPASGSQALRFCDGFTNGEKLKIILFAQSDGTYTIRPTNVSGYVLINAGSKKETNQSDADKSRVVNCITGSTGNSNYYWRIEEVASSVSDIATTPAFNIYLNGTTQGWNGYTGFASGNQKELALWDNSDPGTAWVFEPANYAAFIKSTYTEAKKYVSECANTVGYPASTSSAYTELKAAVDAVDNTTTDYATAKSNLESKLSAYKQATSDINLPEDGKVYKIFAVFHDNIEYALYWNSTATYNKDKSGTGRMAGNTEDNLSSNASRYFFCHKVGEKYMFVNKDGKYLTWLDPFSSNKYNTGATDDYDETKDLWTISRADLTRSGGEIYSSLTVADLVGLLQMNAVGNDSGETFYLNPRKASNSDNGGIMDFVSSNANYKYYDESGDRTFAFRFVEVTDYIPMVFKTGGWNSDDNCYYATYSTPFPVAMPDNVKAYTAAKYVNGSRDLELTEVTGTTIPENVGLLVKYSGELENGVKNIIPVPSVESATSTNNGLTPTNGDRVATFTGTPYVMANKSEGLGFYPLNSGQGVPAFRAYLNLSTQSEEEAVKLTFNNSSVSGISNAASVDSNDNAPVYDLSGRIVSKPLKGIYIKNGKKFVVK